MAKKHITNNVIDSSSSSKVISRVCDCHEWAIIDNGVVPCKKRGENKTAKSRTKGN